MCPGVHALYKIYYIYSWTGELLLLMDRRKSWQGIRQRPVGSCRGGW